MKKRILALSLTLAMLLGVAILPATAIYHDATVTDGKVTQYATPAGAELAEGETVAPKLKASASVDDSYRNKIISQGLAHKQTSATAAEDATLHTKAPKSVTLMGFSSIKWHLGNAVDGKWASGSYNYTTSGKLYNKQGQTAPTDGTADTNADQDYRYLFMYTYNFGVKQRVEAVGYIMANSWQMPMSADIYVSNDGNTWDLVGYYDRNEDRCDARNSAATKNADQYVNISASEVWKDSAGANLANGRLYFFPLQEAVDARYVRIAATTGFGAYDSNFKTAFDAVGRDETSGLVEDYTSLYAPGKAVQEVTAISGAEIMVFGEQSVQIEGAQTKTVEGGYDARFITSVSEAALENANYVRYKFLSATSYTDADGNQTTLGSLKQYNVNTVYSSFLADGEVVEADDGYYYALVDIGSIPEGYSVNFVVSFMIVYNDGTTYETPSVTLKVPAA